MRFIIISLIVLGAVAGAGLLGVAIGYLCGYPARQRLRQAREDLNWRLGSLAEQLLVGKHERHAVLNLATTLANTNTQLLSRLNVQHWREHSEAQPPLNELAAQTPIYSGTPGMTTCLTCGSVVATPDNRVPGAWLLQHTGHQVNIALNQEKYAADLKASEDDDFKDGDIIGG